MNAETAVRKGIEFSLVTTIFFFAVVVGGGQAVMHLWNWLMPSIFGLRAITFWQGFGLLALSWILFGGVGWLGARPRHSARSGRLSGEGWSRMTPEERARLCAELVGRHSPDKTPTDKSND